MASEFPADGESRHMIEAAVLGSPPLFFRRNSVGFLNERSIRSEYRSKLRETCPKTWRYRVFRFRAHRLIQLYQADQESSPRPDSWHSYYMQKAGDIARQLAFAGIAVCWLFKSSVATSMVLPIEIVPSVFWFMVSLGFDLSHYVIGGIVQDMQETPSVIFTRIDVVRNDIIALSHSLSATRILYLAKILSLAVGYGSLLWFLLHYQGIVFVG